MDIGTSAPYTSAVNPSSSYATWVEVDLTAIEGNARLLADMTDARLMAVVKANAYGHGALESARAAGRGGAACFGVARPEEALELRAAGIQEPILVLGPAQAGNTRDLVKEEVSITVASTQHIQEAVEAARSAGRDARVHLKVDTGMSRLGVRIDEAQAMARQLMETEGILFEGLFTHLARADEKDAGPAREQLDRFQSVLGDLEGADLRPPLVHAANSAAALRLSESHYDLIRCGIALYGLQPSSYRRLPAGFRPALSWKSQITRVHELPPGTGISYGHEYVTDGEERIGTIPVGYGDGLRRIDGNLALIGGGQVPVVGRVCMDLVMVRLDGDASATSGDEVVIIGDQGGSRITAEAVADRWGTINYEVTCGIAARVPRLYS